MFLAIINDDDHLKEKAKRFFHMHQKDDCITSTAVLLEVWFYLYKNRSFRAPDAFAAIRGMVSEILMLSEVTLEAAQLLSENTKLSPMDAVHAVLALSTDGIVSSDRSFDRVVGLKRIPV